MRRSTLVAPLGPDTDSAEKVADQETLTTSRVTVCPRFRSRASRSSLLGLPTGLRTLGSSSWTGSPWNTRQLASNHARAMLTAAGVTLSSVATSHVPKPCVSNSAISRFRAGRLSSHAARSILNAASAARMVRDLKAAMTDRQAALYRRQLGHPRLRSCRRGNERSYFWVGAKADDNVPPTELLYEPRSGRHGR
jgi:hypothetical protein